MAPARTGLALVAWATTRVRGEDGVTKLSWQTGLWTMHPGWGLLPQLLGSALQSGLELVNQLLILAPLAKASKALRWAYRPGRTQLIPAGRPAWGWPEHAHPHMSRSLAQGVRALLNDMPTHGVSVCKGHSLRRGGVRANSAQPIRPITACVPVLV